MLKSCDRFSIDGVATDGLEAIALVKSFQPNLLILDFAMPHATGVEIIEEARRWSPSTKIAVLTGMNSRGILQHIFESGVEGIFLKSSENPDLASDFIAICEGEMRIDPAATGVVGTNPQSNALTGRERQILFSIARGETNAAIANRLGISANTVDKHRTNIMRKMGVHSTAALIARAFRDGLFDGASHQ